VIRSLNDRPKTADLLSIMSEVMSQVEDSQSVWRALVAASKKKQGGLYTRYVNRNAAIPLTWTLWKLGLSPNAVSIISFAMTHAALAVLIILGPTLPAAIAAYLLLVFGYMLDSCDGQLARVSGRTSRLGEWLDHSLDVVKLLTVNLTLSYVMITSALAAGESLTLPFIAAALNLLSQPAHFFITNMKVMLFGKEKAATPKAETGGGRAMSAAIRHAADYGVFLLLILLLPWQDLFTWAYFGYGVFALVLLVGHFIQTSRRIARGL
jgi:phosphatidylglycerophosphate synthase